MAALTPIIPTRSAASPDLATGLVAASAGGDTFPAGDNMYLRVVNGSGATVTVTFTPPAAGGPQGTTVAPVTVDVAAAGDLPLGPWPANPFADSSGNVNVSYSATTSVQVEALEMG